MASEPAARSRRTREQIYLAILTVAFRRGFGHVTIDAVADEARISKGRILYHFPTKAAMIESLVAACASRPNPFVAIRDRAADADVVVNALALAVLVAGAESPGLLRSISQILAPATSAPDATTLLNSLLSRIQLINTPVDGRAAIIK